MVTEFQQKRLSTRLRYVFEGDVLCVDIEDAAHQSECRIPYVEIPFENTRFTEKIEALRGASIFFIVLGTLAVLTSFMDVSRLPVAIVQFGLAGAAWVGYKRLRGTYTIFDTERGRIMVLDNKDHDNILGEIESRRRVLLRDAFSEVNTDNDPHHEVRKFEWLRRNGVITDAEYQERVSEIEGKPRLQLPDGPKMVH